MKKYWIYFLALLAVFLIISSTTALPYTNSKSTDNSNIILKKYKEKNYGDINIKNVLDLLNKIETKDIFIKYVINVLNNNFDKNSGMNPPFVICTLLGLLWIYTVLAGNTIISIIIKEFMDILGCIPGNSLEKCFVCNFNVENS